MKEKGGVCTQRLMPNTAAGEYCNRQVGQSGSSSSSIVRFWWQAGRLAAAAALPTQGAENKLGGFVCFLIGTIFLIAFADNFFSQASYELAG